MALLFGIALPLLVHAARLAAAGAAEAGGTALGAIAGTMSMTCCAPVILPAILSFLGFSGTAILRLNETLNRFWLPLAVAGIILFDVLDRLRGAGPQPGVRPERPCRRHTAPAG